jgi:acetyl-CoA acetyltransferase
VNGRFEDSVAVTGLGQSAVGRRLGRGGLDLTVEAALAALADAGLTPSDIDGIATFPGESNDPGFAGASAWELHDALGISAGWYLGAHQTPGQLGPVIDAAMAVACGLATHVLCFRTVTESSAQGDAGRAGVLTTRPVDDFRRWLAPFGAPSAANWLALVAQAHFDRYGTTREQLGWIPIVQRRHAGLNPRAVYRDPMTMAQYLAARMVSTPFGLYDCDVPVDGATAVILSHRSTAADRPRPPVRLEAVGCGLRRPFAWDQGGDLTTMANADAAAMLWSRTDLRPADVDVALLYDGFSFLALSWLEALGFCAPGDGGPFLAEDDGRRIGLDGEIPLNTGGGQLSGGRLHGFGHLHEAVLQLRGEAGDRQVTGAQVAVAAAGGGPLAGCLLLTRS